MRILLRGGTAAEWSTANPTLANREVGVETDTHKIKVGDGTTAWNSLAYLSAALTGVLDDLTDVTITAAASGDILRHNGTAWVDTPGTTHFEAAGAVAAHEADTTSVHGIADTSTLYRSGGTDVAVADGGTGASDATTARSNLGLSIGTNVQAYSARLADLAAISPSQGDVIYYNGTAWVRLAAGTSGQYLRTQGAGGNPTWGTVSTSITLGVTAGDILTSAAATGAAYSSTTSGQLFYVPIYLAAGTLDQIGSETTGAGTDGYRFGIYSNSNGRPGSLILDAGVYNATSGLKWQTISQAVTEGWYWLATAHQGGGTHAILVQSSSGAEGMAFGPSHGAMASASTTVLFRRRIGFSETSISGALPSTPGTLTAQTTSVPIVAVRYA